MSDIYAAQGTYVKTFYSVIFAPSAVKVGTLRDSLVRIHHVVAWDKAVPKIIKEAYKKSRK